MCACVSMCIRVYFYGAEFNLSSKSDTPCTQRRDNGTMKWSCLKFDTKFAKELGRKR